MTTPDALQDAEYLAGLSGRPFTDNDDDQSSTESPESRLRHEMEKHLLYKDDFIQRLIKDLHALAYCELSLLYYMDCSLSRLALRLVIQWAIFGAATADIINLYRPYVGAVLGTNLFCILLRWFFPGPPISEATRGYMHGGVFIDFIGEKGPVPLFRLISHDILVIIIQLVMVGVLIEREKLKIRRSKAASDMLLLNIATEARRQDIDSEERGVHHSSSATASTTAADGTVLSPSGSLDNDTGNGPSVNAIITAALGDSEDPEPGPFILGITDVVELSFWPTIREQWRRNTRRGPDNQVFVNTGMLLNMLQSRARASS